jgi:FKBP-type peptidyl-prolyl cis-trans isomerase
LNFKSHTVYLAPLSPFSFLLFCFLLSCNNSTPTGVIVSSSEKTEETNPFILGSKKIVELENQDIELFLKRYKWEVTQTNTGLKYEITKKGNGKKITTGEKVVLEYKTLLLTGEEIYNSNNDGKIEFIVEKTAEIAGLHEAVELMKRGDEAKLIIPSYLAYGASGDGNKIKPYQTIIMKIVISE